MDLNELERLVELVQGANIRELTLRQDNARVTIRKSVPPVVPGGGLVPVTGYFDEAGAGYTGLNYGEPGAGKDGLSEYQLSLVTASLVGIFRHIKPMIGLGAHVAQGQVLCEIWAMNIPSEVTSPVRGRVVDLLAEDGQPVEYGQELFAIEPEN